MLITCRLHLSDYLILDRKILGIIQFKEKIKSSKPSFLTIHNLLKIVLFYQYFKNTTLRKTNIHINRIMNYAY